MILQTLTIIAAMGRGRVIGKDNRLLWRIPEDLKRFKARTLGHPIIMGRKTFESIGTPLPGRTNIVLTRDASWRHPGVHMVPDLEQALVHAGAAEGGMYPFVIGGGEVYAQALPLCQRLFLTLVDAEAEGDAFFPVYEHLFPNVSLPESMEWNGLHYQWVDLER